tara:strand:- start:319 stop:576 length:258 start_codon:yes stop_codon:yes gene_type:complete
MENKPEHINLSYSAWVELPIDDLDINWDEVIEVAVKWNSLFIITKEGETRYELAIDEAEIDYKWPVAVTLYDGNWNEVYVGQEEE